MEAARDTGLSINVCNALEVLEPPQSPDGLLLGWIVLGMVELMRETVEERESAHQCRAFCWIGLDEEDKARREVEHAREFTPQVADWLVGKLSWVEAHLASGNERLAHLTATRNAFSPRRPADCALVTVQLIEEALALGRYELAEQEAIRLCTLTEKTGSPRVERAILELVSRRTRLTPALVIKMRETVEEAQARRLSRLIVSDY